MTNLDRHHEQQEIASDVRDTLMVEEFKNIDITDDGCDNCPHFCEERDPYNTGDSPTQYSCEGSVKECPRLDRS